MMAIGVLNGKSDMLFDGVRSCSFLPDTRVEPEILKCHCGSGSGSGMVWQGLTMTVRCMVNESAGGAH